MFCCTNCNLENWNRIRIHLFDQVLRNLSLYSHSEWEFSIVLHAIDRRKSTKSNYANNNATSLLFQIVNNLDWGREQTKKSGFEKIGKSFKVNPYPIQSQFFLLLSTTDKIKYFQTNAERGKVEMKMRMRFVFSWFDLSNYFFFGFNVDVDFISVSFFRCNLCLFLVFIFLLSFFREIGIDTENET